MIQLRKAKNKEAEKILEFYQKTIESVRESEFNPKWNENYPNLEFINACIKKQELYIYAEDNNIIACVVLNDKFDPEYENVNWTVEAKSDELIIIHTFAVDSKYAGKGIGKEIFNLIKNNSTKHNKKTIRLDIINGNVGAQKVFESFGFEYIESVEMFHEAVGWEKFHIYEYKL